MRTNLIAILLLCSLTGCGIFGGGTTKITTQCAYPNIPAPLLTKRQAFPSIESYLAGESLINNTLQESH
jgi:hypothetical protein